MNTLAIEATQRDPLSVSCDLLVVDWVQGAKRPLGAALILDKALDGALTQLIESRAFQGKLGERLVFPTFGKLKARHIAVIGVGKKESVDADALRRLGGFVVRTAREHKASSIVIAPSSVMSDKLDARTATQALVEGTRLSAYHFHAFKGLQHKKEDPTHQLKRLQVIASDGRMLKAMQEGIERGQILAEATILARDLVNTPSSDMTPQQLADQAMKLAVKGSGITCKVLDQKTMERLGMRAALAVARGSMHPPVGVHLIYRPKQSKKSIAVVGKAVTFDSGGLSIKPADGMMTMKIDMAGAAAVVGLFKALAVLKPNVTVHGIFLAVENMPSGSAYRPGDIVAAMDGTTIEVLNTDAEGRVTLADALTYATQQKPDLIVDLATLTGACVSALGEDIAGLFSNNEGLSQRLLTASVETGESLWRLPLHKPYIPQIRSKIADIKNIGTGGSGGGAITAALFLHTFVNDIPWAHLDIAGPSYAERETRPDQPYGASGYGVRLLMRFVQALGK